MSDALMRYVRSRRRWVPDPEILFKYTFGNPKEDQCIFCDKPHDQIPLTHGGIDTGTYICDKCNKQVINELGSHMTTESELLNEKRELQYQKLLDVLDNDKPIIADDIHKHLQHMQPSTRDLFAGLQYHCYFCQQEELRAYSMYNHGGITLSDSLPIPVRPSSLMAGRVGICSRPECHQLTINYYHELDNRLNETIFEKTCPQCISKYYITDSERKYREYAQKINEKVEFSCPVCAYDNIVKLEVDLPELVNTKLGEPREEFPTRFNEHACSVCERYESLDLSYTEFSIYYLYIYNGKFVCSSCSGLKEWLNNGYVFKLFSNVYLELYMKNNHYCYNVFEIEYGLLKNMKTDQQLESITSEDALSEAFQEAFNELYDTR